MEPIRRALGPVFIARSFLGLWREAELEAYLGLARRGALSRGQRRRACRQARALARYGIWGFDCVGDQLLAALEHSRGRVRAARRALARALARSEQQRIPYNRWRCLATARDLGAMTPALRVEYHALADKYQFGRAREP